MKNQFIALVIGCLSLFAFSGYALDNGTAKEHVTVTFDYSCATPAVDIVTVDESPVISYDIEYSYVATNLSRISYVNAIKYRDIDLDTKGWYRCTTGGNNIHKEKTATSKANLIEDHLLRC